MILYWRQQGDLAVTPHGVRPLSQRTSFRTSRAYINKQPVDHGQSQPTPVQKQSSPILSSSSCSSLHPPGGVQTKWYVRQSVSENSLMLIQRYFMAMFSSDSLEAQRYHGFSGVLASAQSSPGPWRDLQERGWTRQVRNNTFTKM